jgi:hypothetical protein
MGENMTNDNILNEFYEKTSSEEIGLYKKLVETALKLGYTPKRENKSNGFMISLNNRKLKNAIIMLYNEKDKKFWKLKFYANKNYSKIFDEILKQTFEKFKYLYNNGVCIDKRCGRCKGEKRGYNIEYDDGKKYFLCGFYLIPIRIISKDLLEETVKMMKIQYEAFIEEIKLQENNIMKTKITAPNRSVCVPRPLGAPGFRSARSVASLHPHFVGPANATHLLIRAAKTS